MSAALGRDSIILRRSSRSCTQAAARAPVNERFLVLFVEVPMIRILGVFAACFLAAAAAAANLKPPATQIIDVKTDYFGTVVSDPYRWLEDGPSANVQAWIETQNAYADGILAAYPGRTAISQRIRQLSLTGTQKFGPQIVGRTLFFFRQTPPQQQPVFVTQTLPAGAERVLLDVNAAGGGTTITDAWPSPDGRYVAYGIADAGTEDTTIHVVDVSSGHVLADALPRAGGGTTPQAVAWDSDSRGFTHTRLPLRGSVAQQDEEFNVALYHHRLGRQASADSVQIPGGLSRIAEWTLLDSDDGSQAAGFVHFGDGQKVSVYLRHGAAWTKVLGVDAGVPDLANGAKGAFVGDRLYVIATSGSLRGRIAWVQASGLHTIVPEGDWAMQDIAPVRGGFLVNECWGAGWRVRQYTIDGKYVRTVALPVTGIGIGAIASSSGSADAVISYSGWTLPTRWVRYSAVTGSLTQIYALKPAADYSSVAFTQLDAVSKDGTHVPVTVLYKRGAAPDGSAPGVLTAYGGYGQTTRPGFIGPTLAWIERGGVYAVAYIRGGGEFGEAWHLNGALLKKQNDYDDFTACAQALVSSGWVKPDRLGIVGGSNGGQLMGVAMTEHPELYRAVVSFVGIYDVLREETHPNGEYNTKEFGTSTNPDQFKSMYAYSPYDNVKDGTAYPATLLITGENDPRVATWQSRKFGARLQAANASDHPILVLTRRAAGHGVGASFSQRLGDRAAEFTFFSGELGL